MAFLLRIIGSRRLWFDPLGDWLPPNKVVADVFHRGLRTTEGNLSTYFVAVDNYQNNVEDPPEVERIVAAYACTRNKIQNVDFVMIPTDALEATGLEYKESDGNTADDAVNSWHRDIIELSTEKLSRFAELILSFEQFSKRVGEKRIDEFVKSGIKQGNIDPNAIDIQLRDKFLKQKFLNVCYRSD